MHGVRKMNRDLCVAGGIYPGISLKELRRCVIERLSEITLYAEREADILLGELTGLDKLGILLGEEAADAQVLAGVADALEKRGKRIPLQYILGKAYFRRLVLEVGEGVLIPRPETEILVDFVLDEVGRLRALRGGDAVIRILDIGTGSGAIAASIADETAGEKVCIEAVDISEDALAIASRNLERYDNVRVYRSDLFENVQGTFDIICSNPPYVSESERSELAPEVLCEPERALFAEEDGLAIYRRILSSLNAYMEMHGSVVFEIGASQYAALKDMFFEVLGRTDVEPIYDYSGRRRFICMKNSK